MMRVFRASGQYRDEKPNAYYSKMADEELAFVKALRQRSELKPQANTERRRAGINAKS